MPRNRRRPWLARKRAKQVSNVQSVLISVPVIAALIAASVALFTLAVNQRQAAQDRRRKAFADALTAVERYAELPYRIRRRQGSDAGVRDRLSALVHDVQQDILFHTSWLRIQAPRVADAYDSLVNVARQEAGVAMAEAWQKPPIGEDEEMNLKVALSFPKLPKARSEYIQAVRRELRLPVLWSGSRVALLTPGPLRTVRARFRAHSSSEPLTRSGAHRLTDGVGLASGFAAVDLLMAVQVYQFQVRVRVLAPLRPWFDVVPV